ncbi:hypothetical protein KYG33_00835 [Chryseobacterium sp. D764]|jgi:hypothetical protein|uniref:hypothetical protein n=1 Tax=unclassified Chryseobacterium TaxID=2593645 RepID=UPI0015C1DC05|nr:MULTISPECIES: hypothetical protein [unclassified Chryseobacterium]QXU49626.1 hypothetical protein KYG33_00835 [Chryseobacterium sp. D764]CAD0225771.1 conserved membrane protein of unknown function [Chryseobacterium sp. JV274]
MKLNAKNPLVLMMLCLMAGVFITVSFLETPMKFQVPGMTLPVALELGMMMFGISTKIQCVFLILIVAGMFVSRKKYTKTDFIIIAVLLAILLLEKFWMLPALDNRAQLLSAGKPVLSSEMHNYFIYAESAKAIFLCIAISLQFIKQKNEY